MAVALEDAIGADNIQVIASRDPGTTGRFEVTILPDKLIYSKSTRGQAKAESDSDRAEIIRQIQEHIGSK